jgi:hypothetical protein
LEEEEEEEEVCVFLPSRDKGDDAVDGGDAGTPVDALIPGRGRVCIAVPG